MQTDFKSVDVGDREETAVLRMWRSLKTEASRIAFWATFLPVAAGLYGTYEFISLRIETAVDSRVDERLTPYIRLNAALNASANLDHWGASQELKQVLKLCHTDTGEKVNNISKDDLVDCLGDSNANAFFNAFLWAVVNSHALDFHWLRQDLRRIVEIEGVQNDGDAWRLQQLGILRLRESAASEALKHFDRSIQVFREHRDFRGSASSHWFRAVTLASLGRTREAGTEIRYAISCSPSQYATLLTPGEVTALLQEPTTAGLTTHNYLVEESLVASVKDILTDAFISKDCATLAPAMYTANHTDAQMHLPILSAELKK